MASPRACVLLILAALVTGCGVEEKGADSPPAATATDSGNAVGTPAGKVDTRNDR